MNNDFDKICKELHVPYMSLDVYEQLVDSDEARYKMPKTSFIVIGGAGIVKHAYFVPSVKHAKKVLFDFELFYNLLCGHEVVKSSIDLKMLPNSKDHQAIKSKRKAIFKKKQARAGRRAIMTQLGKFLDAGVLTGFASEDNEDEIVDCALFVAGRLMGYKLKSFPKCKTAAILLSNLRKWNFQRIWEPREEVV
jgi:hypothetical protein